MDVLIEFAFGAETPVIVEPSGCVLNISVCNESLQHVEDTVAVSLEYEAEIFAKIVEYDEFKATVKKRDGTKLFTGQVTSDTSWKDNGEPYPIDELTLTIRDYTYKLQVNTPGEISLINTSFADVVMRIASDRGLIITGVIPDIPVPAFVVGSGRQYLNILDTFCFQHKQVFNFDSLGRLYFLDFSDIPEEIATLDDSALMTGVSVKKSKKKYASVSVGFNTLVTRLNEQVYFENPGYDSDHAPAPVIIQPGVYYPFEATPIVEADEGQIYQSFESGFAESYKKYNGEVEYRRSKKTTLLYTYNHRVVQDWTGPLVINRTGFESLQASVRLLNDGLVDASLNQFAIRADAIYRNVDGSVTAGPNDSEKSYSYDAEFIYATSAAQSLATALFRFFTKSNYLIDFSLDEYTVPLGSFRIIDTGLSGFSGPALVIAYTLDCKTDIYSYKSISVGSPTVNITHSKSQSSCDTAVSGEALLVATEALESAESSIKTYFETRYARSASQPDTPTDAHPAGWTITVPSGSDAIWMSGAQKDSDGALIGTWYTPVRFTGAATIVGVLTNENHSVPTDEDGNNGNYTGAETQLNIYEGSVNTTALWTIGATPSAGVTGSLVGNKYTVTLLTNDAAYIDIVATRSGMDSITRRFSITRARQGDPVPAYMLRSSTTVVKVYLDGTKSPDSVTLSAFSSIGLAEPTPYEGIFKLYVNDVLQFISTVPQSSFTWDGFGDVPTETDVPSETDFPKFSFEEALEDVQLMRVELWSDDGAVMVDAQSIAFLKDVGFQLQDIIDAALDQVPDRTPKYLGRYNASVPASYRWGDWFLIYDTDDTPFVRGVYRVNSNLSTTRITGTDGADAPYILAALPDILWAVKNGYGTTASYGAVTYIQNLVSDTAFIEALVADEAFIESLYVKHLDGADGTFSGSLEAATGTFSGAIQTGQGILSGDEDSDSIRASGRFSAAGSINAGLDLGALRDARAARYGRFYKGITSQINTDPFYSNSISGQAIYSVLALYLSVGVKVAASGSIFRLGDGPLLFTLSGIERASSSVIYIFGMTNGGNRQAITISSDDGTLYRTCFNAFFAD